MNQHYTPDEANAILERAIQRRALPGDMSREQLLKLGEEVGVSPEDLEAAEVEYRQQAEADRYRAMYREARKRRGVAGLIVMGFILATSVLPAIADHGGGDWLAVGQILLIFLVIGALVAVKSFSPWAADERDDFRFQRWLYRRRRRGLPVPPALLNAPPFERRDLTLRR